MFLQNIFFPVHFCSSDAVPGRAKVTETGLELRTQGKPRQHVNVKEKRRVKYGRQTEKSLCSTFRKGTRSHLWYQKASIPVHPIPCLKTEISASNLRNKKPHGVEPTKFQIILVPFYTLDIKDTRNTTSSAPFLTSVLSPYESIETMTKPMNTDL